MNKLASFNYDILDHILAGDFEKIGQVVKPLSNAAKTASVPNFEETQEMPDKDFALITYHPEQGEVKKYAKYDSTSTELSIAFLKDRYKDLPQEIVNTASTNLSKAASFYGLSFPEDLRSFVKTSTYVDPRVNIENIKDYTYGQTPEIKVASYALPTEGKYPIDTKKQIEKAAMYFNTNVNNFQPAQAIEYAVNVAKAAGEHNVDISKTRLEKFANLDTGSLHPDFKYHIQQRRSYIPASDEEAHKAYISLEKVASDIDPNDVISELTSIDVEYKLNRYWDNGFPNPARATLREKIAADGTTLSLEQLRSIPKEDLEGVVGSDAINDLIGDEGSLIYDTLPMPIKNEVRRLAGES